MNSINKSRSDSGEYAIMIPCPQEDFAAFVSGLLGKAQSIDRYFLSPFDIDRRGIENIFRLVDQRVCQQNEASLVQFTVRVIYDDDSSVLLDSFDAFVHYSEIRPLTSSGVHLSWVYLIKFRDRTVPERQQINLTFTSGLMSGRIGADGFVQSVDDVVFATKSSIRLRIDHTARTWGVDIESLLVNHICTFFRKQNPIRSWMNGNSGKVAILAAVLFFTITTFLGYHRANQYLADQLAIVQEFLQSAGGATSLEKKIDFMIRQGASGGWQRFATVFSTFGIAAAALSIVFGALAGWLASKKPNSFVVLTHGAQTQKAESLRSERLLWLSFIGAIVTEFVVGFGCNAAFSMTLGKWLSP